MRRTALLVAAQPEPYSGPWVPLRWGVWEYSPAEDLADGVVVEVKDADHTLHRYSLNSSSFKFDALEGTKARATILGKDLKGLVTVELRRMG